MSRMTSSEQRHSSERRFYVVPHTHWDREWYQPLEFFRLELGRVVDGVLEVLERDPSFRSFTLDGQAVVLEDYLEVRPRSEQRLRALLAAGRLEVGPSYVLPDEFLVGAEPLVRNLLIGREVCERFGAAPSPVGYLPDSFGHPSQLPQILAGFGIDSFVFMRGLGDQFEELGAVFRWRAPDGSEVLAFQQLAAYSNFAGLGDADTAQSRVLAVLERFGPALERAGMREILLCNGDDHSPVEPELPSWCAELERRLEGTKFTIAGFADYARAARPVNPPAFGGELLGSRLQNVLRGVNSARLYLKQANERAEQRLLSVETLSALATLQQAAPFPQADFQLAWRDLLRCQPHDSICGCSCDEVHRDMLVRYESLQRTLTVLQERALSLLAGMGGVDRPTEVSAVNLLPYRRRGLIELAGAEPVVVEVDGFTARSAPQTPARSARPRDGAVIESERFRIEAAADGTLTVGDKRAGRSFEGLHALEDEPDMGDLYNFCAVPGQRPRRCPRAATRVLREGPVVWELELRIEAERPAGLDAELQPLAETVRLVVVTVVRLVQGSDRVEFRTTVDNPARDHRLRVAFATPSAGGVVRAEGQFAVIGRPLVPPPPRTKWAEPPDATQHTVGAVALGPIALLTKGLPEYEARASGDGAELCLTLLRCVGLISRPSGALVSRPYGAGPQTPTPEGQCLGRHELEYALLADADSLDEAELVRASQDYKCGFLLAAPGVRLQAPLRLEGDVVYSCLKGAQDGDGVILRCFNPGTRTARTRVGGPLAVARTRLDETGERPLADGVVELGPGEIGTLRLRRSA